MGIRLLTAVLVFCLAASAETLSIAQLSSFIRSAAKMNTDKDVANYLAGVKLSEKLDDRTVEEWQALGVGPRTLKALYKLRDESKDLPAAAPLPPPPPKPAPAPPPSSEEQAAVIDEVRNYALNYSKNLPDFICAQVTVRKVAPAPGGKYGRFATSGDPAWQTMDRLTMRLSYFEQKENYKVILRNDSPVNQEYEKIGGPKSFGDFGSLMRELFIPSSQARFEWDHWARLNKRLVMAFSYHVPQSHSQYRLVVEDLGKSIVAGYRGMVWVDADTHTVLRISVVAENVPPDFPIREAETVLNYDYQDLSGHSFLLPRSAHIEMRGTDVLNRIEEDFRLYRKYSAESELKFDTEVLPPEGNTQPAPAPQKP